METMKMFEHSNNNNKLKQMECLLADLEDLEDMLKTCNVRNVAFLVRIKITSMVSATVRSIKRLTSSISATFAVT